MLISIHALRGEGDLLIKRNISAVVIFQSTPSVGRATQKLQKEWRYKNISIHALRGEGDQDKMNQHRKHQISIHALRGEGDSFYAGADWDDFSISIHALRGEGDAI